MGCEEKCGARVSSSKLLCKNNNRKGEREVKRPKRKGKDDRKNDFRVSKETKGEVKNCPQYSVYIDLSNIWTGKGGHRQLERKTNKEK